jgi:hypothetical protein
MQLYCIITVMAIISIFALQFTLNSSPVTAADQVSRCRRQTAPFAADGIGLLKCQRRISGLQHFRKVFSSGFKSISALKVPHRVTDTFLSIVVRRELLYHGNAI